MEDALLRNALQLAWCRPLHVHEGSAALLACRSRHDGLIGTAVVAEHARVRQHARFPQGRSRDDA